MPTQLNPQQLEAVTHLGSPCLVLAGAGSGKTRVITERIAWLVRERGVPPSRIGAVTFTNKAAAEMRQRVSALLGGGPPDLCLATFHALGLRLLREVAGAPGAPPRDFAVADRADAVATWRRCQAELDINAVDNPPQRLFDACSRAVNALEDPASWDGTERPLEQRLAARVWVRYRAAMRERMALDFDDLLLWPLRLMTSDAGLRRTLAGRFDHLLVDEYQDTNRLQYRLVRELVGDGELMVVGDEDQSIYRWRGADIANVLDFRRDFPGARVVRLEQNYRSTQPILAAAGSLIAHNRERLGKRLFSELTVGPKPLLMRCHDERQEAVWASKRIAAALADGVAASDIAVLYRTNAQSRAFEEELAGRGVAFRVIGGPTFFRRAEVKDALAALRLVVRDDDDALERLVGSLVKGVGPATLRRLVEGERGAAATLLAAAAGTDAAAVLRSRGCSAPASVALAALGARLLACRALIGERSLADLAREVVQHVGLLDRWRREPDGEERLAHVDELIASASEQGDDAASVDGVAAFLDRAALVSDAESSSGEAGVSLLTVHAAKGLEFHTVVVAGLEEGVFPHGSAIQDGGVEEERRLAYVAMTRARRCLLLSCVRLRRWHGQERLQHPSRFLGEIAAEALDVQEEPTLAAASRPALPRGYRPGLSRQEPARVRVAAPVDPRARGSGRLASDAELAPGAGVFHAKFGPGRVESAVGEGDQLKVTVAFARAGTKDLVARYARLQTLA